LLLWCLALILLVLLLPYLLVPLYKLPEIRPVSTLMLAETLSGRAYERQWVGFDDIAPVLVQSVMMSEDGQYCAHSGVDWEALNLVIDDALEGEVTRGASTIPMQTAKNLFLPSTRSVLRKALEIPIAMWMDVVWSKRRLMEIYLNIAEWAPGIYGIEAALAGLFRCPGGKALGPAGGTACGHPAQSDQAQRRQPLARHETGWPASSRSAPASPAPTSNAFMIEFNGIGFSGRPAHARCRPAITMRCPS
jgi:membrane peptidoglycan carboxypeptidase